MATKSNLNNPLSHLTAGYNNMRLGIQLKEEIHVFEEKPRIDAEQETADRRGAHELFSLFTADIIKNNITFPR